MLKTQQDIVRDTDALNALRDEVDARRRPLAQRLDALQQEVRAQREEVARLRQLQNLSEKERSLLESNTRAVEEQGDYLQTVFSDYARSMETRLGAVDALAFAGVLRPVHETFADLEHGDGLAKAIEALLQCAAEVNEQRLGGMRVSGVALDEQGIEHTGHFAVAGPAAYFAAEEGDLSGLALTGPGTDRPTIYAELSAEARQAIRALVQGADVDVPVDVSGGDAVKVARAKPSFFAHLRHGGLVMIPLLMVALTALLLAGWKTLEFRRMNLPTEQQLAAVVEALRDGPSDAARSQAGDVSAPFHLLADVAARHPQATREQLEELMHERVLSCVPELERNLGTLAVLGGIAPLLGLLGTVTGMIHTFQLVTVFGSGDASLLSGGISEALVTTEAGLCIAIPILLVHAFLARRARRIVSGLESAAVRLINDLKIQAVTP